jgi:serine/threonine-protein kinase
VTSDLSDERAPPSDDAATLPRLARGTDAPTRLVQPGDETVVDLPPTSGMPLVDLDDVEGFEAHPRRHRWLRALLVLLVLAGLGAGGYVAYDRLAAVPTYAVPKLTDLSADAANSAVLEAGHGWKVRKETARQDGSVVGSILRQEPAFGEELKRDGTITLYISAGNTLADVPPATALVGKTYDEAVQILQVAGFGAKRVDVTSEDVGKDTVLGFHLEEGETDPSRLPKQTEVALDVSSGPAPRTVPAELGDGSYEAAAAAIQAVQLVPKKVEVFDDTAPAGKVVGTSPAAGASVPRDGTVEVRVSKGPDLVKVPAVKGLTLQQAISALEGAGLTVGDVFGPAKGQPFTTQPEAGTSVKRGTTVDIYLK